MSATTNNLTTHLKNTIDHQGPIGFDEFMSTCLYHPKFGYYSQKPAFGAEGDFVTAPTLGNVFAECLAHQVSEIFQSLEKPSLLELGAGNGRLAAHLLLALEKNNQLPQQYLVSEISQKQIEAQKQNFTELCPHLSDRINWVDINTMDGFSGVILANELLDAMPVQKFQITEGKPEWLCVAYPEHFEWTEQPITNDAAIQHLTKLADTYNWPDGYSNEINTALPEYLKTLTDKLTQGVMLFIDYGYPEHEYYSAARTTGNLKCYHQHNSHNDVFANPGEQDLTCHVDFTQVASIAANQGLDILGYTNQASFLIANQITAILEQHQHNQTEYFTISQEVKQLTSPNHMGEIFKVIALGKNYDAPLCGFAISDHCHRL